MLSIPANTCPKFWKRPLSSFMVGGNLSESDLLGQWPMQAYLVKKHSKLEAKARCRILVGHVFKTRGYRIWFPETNEIVESINVSLDEKSQPVLECRGVMMDPDDYTLFSPGTGENHVANRWKYWDTFLMISTIARSWHVCNRILPNFMCKMIINN